MWHWLRPKREISEAEFHRGLRVLVIDGVCTQIMGVLTGGAFLVAYTLLLGGSNKTVGLVAAISPLTQLLQLPATLLVTRVRRRKALVVLSALVARLHWLVIAAVPWLVPPPLRLPVFLGALGSFFAIGAVTGCAFNPWMRDLLPDRMMGGFLAKRLAIATAVSAVVGLGAGLFIDRLAAIGPQVGGYSALFVGGGMAGLTGALVLSRAPEPLMPEVRSRPILDILHDPLRDRDYRQLIIFLGTWSFAVNLAAPFFVVYMLRRLELSMTIVIALSVLSQLMNALFLRLWARLADSFSNRSVLSVAGSLFLVSILLWPFTSLPGATAVAVPLLVLIHLAAGISTAGVTLCSGTIALKAAPRGEATAYLATNALVSGAAATLAPIVAGIAADWFATKRLLLDLHWVTVGAAGRTLTLSPLDLRGLDFLFILAFVAGLYAMHRLLAVREEGTVKERVVVLAFYDEVRKSIRDVSNVPGLRQLTDFPYAVLGQVFRERRRGHRRGPPTPEELAMRGSGGPP